MSLLHGLSSPLPLAPSCAEPTQMDAQLSDVPLGRGTRRSPNPPVCALLGRRALAIRLREVDNFRGNCTDPKPPNNLVRSSSKKLKYVIIKPTFSIRRLLRHVRLELKKRLIGPWTPFAVSFDSLRQWYSTIRNRPVHANGNEPKPS